MSKVTPSSRRRRREPSTTPAEITTFPNAVRYLLDRTDYERMRLVRYNEETFKLDRMHTILDALGNPQEQVRMVHVAGTVGKGSTVAMISSMLQGCGYAVGVHGSLARDIDLVAVPWTEEATTAAEVAEAIRAAAEKSGPCGQAFVAGNDPCPRRKPHGRLCWSFHLGGGPYIDLSVVPRPSSPRGLE